MVSKVITNEQISNLGLANQPIILKGVIDCSEVNDGAGIDQSDEDTYEIIDIPAGYFVDLVVVNVETIEDSAASINVGDGATVDGWNSTVDLTAAAASHSITGTDDYATAAGKAYLTADTIDLVFSADCDTAKISVFARAFKITDGT